MKGEKHTKGHKRGVIIKEMAHTKLSKDELAKRKGGLLSQALHIFKHPGKIASHPVKKVYYKQYHGTRNAKIWFAIDIVLLLGVIAAGIFLAYSAFWKPTSIADRIIVTSTIAPKDIVSGDASTLVFYYKNGSQETLYDAYLTFGFPPYFDIAELDGNFEEIGDYTYALGEIEPGEEGRFKLRGTMFGSVNEEQVFLSNLAFQYGEERAQAIKHTEHAFTPIRSTLELELALPDYVVEGQQVEGSIAYRNTGSVSFPELSIEPEWPDGFTLLSSDPVFSDGRFRVDGIDPQEEGIISFTGILPEGNAMHFTFHPHFVFGNEEFNQQDLAKTIPLLPPPIALNHSVEEGVLIPGSSATVTVQYEHQESFDVEDVEIRISSNSPFISRTSTDEVRYEDGAFIIEQTILEGFDVVTPGESGEITVEIPLRSSISASEISSVDNVVVDFTSQAVFTIPGDIDQRTQVRGDVSETIVSTPLILESFARFASPQGDQIGRGSIPPRVGSETKYWVFMTIDGTIHPLESVSLNAILGPNVTFTGKQSVSIGNPLSYDTLSGTISWDISAMQATLPSYAPVASVAFEVSITPTSDMTGTTPILLYAPTITSRDAVTGVITQAGGATVTTNLPYDAIAAELGVVIE